VTGGDSERERGPVFYACVLAVGNLGRCACLVPRVVSCEQGALVGSARRYLPKLSLIFVDHARTGCRFENVKCKMEQVGLFLPFSSARNAHSTSSAPTTTCVGFGIEVFCLRRPLVLSGSLGFSPRSSFIGLTSGATRARFAGAEN